MQKLQGLCGKISELVNKSLRGENAFKITRENFNGAEENHVVGARKLQRVRGISMFSLNIHV